MGVENPSTPYAQVVTGGLTKQMIEFDFNKIVPCYI